MSFSFTRYDLAYYAAAPLAAPLIAWKWARRGKYSNSAPGMFGRDLPRAGSAEAARFAGGSIWLHAVSVGEVAAAKAIEPGLRAAFPGLPLVLSVVTETGFEAARRSIPSADAHTFFPADLSWNVSRFLEAYRPRVVVIMETEIWPNFITLSARRGADVFLVNAKISDRSFPRYRRARGLLAPVFDSLAGVIAQTEEDAERFRGLGVAPERVKAVGNVKFDLRIAALTREERAAGRAELGLTPDRPVVIAGSTHEGEEKLMLAAFRRVLEVIPGAAMIICPRHPERFNAVAELIARERFSLRRASALEAGSSEKAPQVVLLDKMGALARAYGLCEAAIVAGSFCQVGGHNLLEPAAHGVPVIYGPNMKSQREMARLFEMRHAGIQVRGVAGLALAIIERLGDPVRGEAWGDKARRALEENQGAAGRAIEAMIEIAASHKAK